MRRSLFLSALAAHLVLLPASALAGSVFLNGVRIDGVTNQKFEKATVRIDEQGNVHIDAPGYAVRMVTPPPSAAPATPAPAAPAPAAAPTPASAPAKEARAPSRITRRYWLVTEQTAPGMTEYDIDLYVNSKWVRKLRNGEEQVVSEITRHLLPGKNTVLFVAHKVAGEARRSLSPEHVFRIIIGEGNEGGGNLMIDNPLVRFQRTAADDGDVSEEFTLSTR
ncbi:MAG TPA: hypothetical protein VLQ93_10350 [Myxococcaceae bacterium]|nr:hypothetical protein [Myxococcaceae bacterium]